MDNRRVILAVALSLGVLIIWNFLFPPAKPTVHPKDENGSQQQVQQQTVSTPKQAPQWDQPAPALPTAGKKITIKTPLYEAAFNTQGGLLQEFYLKKYKQTVNPNSADVNLIQTAALAKAPMGLIWNTVPTWSQGKWSVKGHDLQLSKQEQGELTFIGTLGGLTLQRRLLFKGDDYGIKEELTVINNSETQVRGLMSFTVASTGLPPLNDNYNLTRIAYLGPEGLQQENDKDDLGLGFPEMPEFVQWAGVENNYFLLGLIPKDGNMAVRSKLESDIYRVTVGKELILEPKLSQMLTCSYYIGPKMENELALMPNNLDSSINYGWFDIIAKPLISFLHFLYSYVGNYGVAIIILTVLIKAAFWPLSQKSYKSMEQMKKLQPMMAQLREKYKDDREKMNAELMQLYKTYKVNPAGGCLPMMLQIPVFIALYQALLGSIELRHAPFIAHLPFTDLPWLIDLSAKDPYYITPLIMGATMFLQQKMTPAPGDPTQAKVMMFMPLIFTFIFLNFPSGLVVYWLVNNVLSILQQWLLSRKS